MLAMNYRGPLRVRIDEKPMPQILHPEDAVVRVTRSCICGSDLHLYNGSVPDTRVGMTFGHEFTGVVEQVGPAVRKLKVGDHVLVPFNIACGKCVFCQQELYGNCHESNSQATAVGGIFGYSHTAGGYDGGQAEYVRVPYADVGPAVIPEGMDPDDAVLLTDVVPTGYQAAEMGGIQKGDTVVVFGAGPVGLFAAQSATVMGAAQVIVIDHYPHRLELARQIGAKVIDYQQTNVLEALMEMTGGQGPDAVIDAVGMESHGFQMLNPVDTLKQKVGIGADRIGALREAIMACRKGGRVSIPGVYGGMADKFPTGAVMEKGLTVRTGQTHVQRYLRPLLERIEDGQIDPSFVITHTVGLEDGPEMYKVFRDKQDSCIKVVLKP